ncbi:MAG: hypothetical protein WCF85_02305 [Rhodospirillaceae bacterium]
MSPEREADLFAKLDLILSRINALDGDMREIKGQQTVLLAWLQATDQRFMAMMAPIAQNRKSGS